MGHHYYINMKILGYIYQIRNKVNDKVYIGQTTRKNFKIRWTRHIYELKLNKHINRHLQQAWNLYGENNFSFELIEIVYENNNVTDREQYYINNTMCYLENKGYNLVRYARNPFKGKIPWNKGLTKETSEKVRLSVEKASKSSIGKKHSIETKLKMSLSAMGKPKSEEQRKKISLSKKGKKLPPFTQEHRDKIAKAHRLNHQRKILEKMMVA